MTKQKTRKVARVKESSAKVGGIDSYVVALQRVAALVAGFVYVQNPPTQFVQREVSAKVKVTLPDRKTAEVVTLAEYIPARMLDAKGKVIEQNKRHARALLTAYALGKVKNPKAEVATLAAYLAAKVLTSRPRSLEGVLSAQCLLEVERTTGISVQECGESTRDMIDAKVAELQNYLEAGIAAGFISAVRGRRKQNAAKELNL